jgi:hypothetical protein
MCFSPLSPTGKLTWIRQSFVSPPTVTPPASIPPPSPPFPATPHFLSGGVSAHAGPVAARSGAGACGPDFSGGGGGGGDGGGSGGGWGELAPAADGGL